jgi:hypothetical protein
MIYTKPLLMVCDVDMELVGGGCAEYGLRQ